jgi:CubicO group peptidase (beta-lactamase class C family)
MINRKLITVLTLLLVAISSLYSTTIGYTKPQTQAAYADKIETFAQTQMQEYKIPGMAVAIVRNGEVEYLEGFGVANPNGDPVTPDTPFLLASVSKSFTALGVMQLIEDGKISLDDPVQTYLPWFDVKGEGGAEITVAHLVYQTSGFTEYEGNEMNLRPNTPNGLEEGVRDLSHIKLEFNPGEGWEYSNINYSVLGLLIQEVSGQRYETYVEENIFTPLGMTNSYTSLESARAGNASRGYYPLFGIPLALDQSMLYTTATLPAFGLWSSAADMSRYLIAQLDEESATLLSTAGMKRIHTPGVEIEPGYSYAMGWFHSPAAFDPEFLQTLGTDIDPSDDQQVLWHEGDWKGYKSVALLLPGLDYGVVMLMNTNDPAIASVYRAFAWDVTLIANGGDAYYFTPGEDFIVRNSRPIFSVVVLLLLGTLIWEFRQRKNPASKNKVWVKWVSLLINLGLLSFIHLKLLPDNHVSVWVLYNQAPDLGTLTILVTILSSAWIAVSIWALTKARSK